MTQRHTTEKHNSRKSWGKAALTAAILLALTASGMSIASACTTFIAGRGATGDGSRIIGIRL